MGGQQGADAPYRGKGALLVALVAKRQLHFAAHGVPFALCDARVDAAIGEYLDLAVDQLDVDQDTAVFLGIPHPQIGKQFDRALSGRLPVPDWQQIQTRLDREAVSPRWLISDSPMAASMATRVDAGKARRTDQGGASR